MPVVGVLVVGGVGANAEGHPVGNGKLDHVGGLSIGEKDGCSPSTPGETLAGGPVAKKVGNVGSLWFPLHILDPEASEPVTRLPSAPGRLCRASIPREVAQTPPELLNSIPIPDGPMPPHRDASSTLKVLPLASRFSRDRRELYSAQGSMATNGWAQATAH